MYGSFTGRFAIINKPANLSIFASSAESDSVQRRLQSVHGCAGRSIHFPHRLDKHTAGLLVVCFDLGMCRRMGQQLERKEWRKKYRVIARLPDTVNMKQTLSSSSPPAAQQQGEAATDSPLQGRLWTASGLLRTGTLQSWLVRRPPPAAASYDETAEYSSWQAAAQTGFSAPSAAVLSPSSRRVHPFVPETMLYFSTTAPPPPPAAVASSSRGRRGSGSERKPDRPKLATTSFRLLDTDPARRLAMWEAELHSGRSHQIRIHWSDAGAAVLQDPYYSPQYLWDIIRLLRLERDSGRQGCEGEVLKQAVALRGDGDLDSRQQAVVLIHRTPEKERRTEQAALEAGSTEQTAAGRQDSEQAEGEEDESAEEGEESAAAVEDDEEISPESDSSAPSDPRFQAAAASFHSTRHQRPTVGLGPSFYVLDDQVSTQAQGPSRRTFSTQSARGRRGGGRGRAGSGSAAAVSKQAKDKQLQEEEEKARQQRSAVYDDVLRRYGVEKGRAEEQSSQAEVKDDEYSLQVLKEEEEAEAIRQQVEARRERRTRREEDRADRQRGSNNPLRRAEMRRRWEDFEPSDTAGQQPDEQEVFPSSQSASSSSLPASIFSQPRQRKREVSLPVRETATRGWLARPASSPSDSTPSAFASACHDMAMQAYYLQMPHPELSGKTLTVVLPLPQGWRQGGSWTRAEREWAALQAKQTRQTKAREERLAVYKPNAKTAAAAAASATSS